METPGRVWILIYPPSQKTTAVRPWMNAGVDPPKLGERRRVLRRISPKK
jgi:hypothetical protein